MVWVMTESESAGRCFSTTMTVTETTETKTSIVCRPSARLFVSSFSSVSSLLGRTAETIIQSVRFKFVTVRLPIRTMWETVIFESV